MGTSVGLSVSGGKKVGQEILLVLQHSTCLRIVPSCEQYISLFKEVARLRHRLASSPLADEGEG